MVLATALACAIAGVAVVASSVGPAAAAAHTSAARPRHAATESAASALAVSSGNPVIVDADTSETELVTAEPTGVFDEQVSVDPVRKNVGGTWHDLDTSLSFAADGSVRPGLVAGDLKISGGGPAGSPIATYDEGDFSYAVSSPFHLPTPVLEEDSAVYADVLPDVDLVVRATVVGFTYNWVIDSAQAAADPRLDSLTMPVSSPGVSPQATDGGVAYVDGRGARRFWTPTPLMWDSSAEPEPSGDMSTLSPRALAARVTTAVDDGSAGGHVAPVEMDVTQGRVTLTPDADLLEQPSTVFPVVIDPGVSENDPKRSAYTAVWDIYPKKSFWNTDHSLGAGYEGYEQDKVVRSYFKFNTSKIEGKHVIAAEMNVKQIHDASCTARPTQVYRTGNITSATTWNKQPSRFSLQDSNSKTTGCKGGTGMVGWNVKKAIGSIAAGMDATGSFMIRAKNESDKIAWKQFDDAGAALAITFVSTPRKPAIGNLHILANNKVYDCGTSAAPTLIGTTSIKLREVVTSPDKGNAQLKAVFTRAWKTTTYSSLVSGKVASGKTGTVSWTTANNTTYHITAKARAVWTYNGTRGTLDSPATAACYFRVDTSKPAPPDVSSTDFTECASASAPDSCVAQGVIGVPGSVTLDSPSSDATTYYWQFNGGTTHSATVTGGAAKTIALTPAKDVNKLIVWARDGANNESTHPSWLFKVHESSPADAWSFDAGDGSTNSEGSGHGALTLGAATVSDHGRVGTRALTTSDAGPATTTDTTARTTADFTASLWVRLDGTGAGTFLAAPSANGDAFEIGYDADDTWFAGRRSSGATDVVGTHSAADGVARAWTNLTATYDASAKKLVLYVNGRQAGSHTFADAAWANTGWWLGCADDAGTPARCLTGTLDEVDIYEGVLPTAQIARRADPVDSTSDQRVVASAARWEMDDPTGTSTAEDSDFDDDLTLGGTDTPTFGAAADGEADGVLAFDGGNAQSATVKHAVVDSTGSFTIAASVMPSTRDQSMVIAQQEGGNGPAWTLGWRTSGNADGTGQWVFDRELDSSAGSAVAEVRSPVTVDDGTFHVLVATYDAYDGQLQLFVDGNPFATEGTPPTDSVQSTDFGTPWQPRGDFSVGNGELDGTSAPYSGDIDFVEAFSGAMVDYDAVLGYADGE